MRILAFDTATRATAVAVCDSAGRVVEERDDPPPGHRPGHATKLMRLAVDALEQSNVGWDDIERVAVGIGPGSFTGLRIGVATARAIAQAREIPIVGVSTLRALALGARAWPQRIDCVVAALDARRGEVFVGAWRPRQLDHVSEVLLGPAVMAPERLARAIGTLGSPSLAIGDGAVEFRAVLERSGAFIPEDDSELHRITAINHCQLARLLRASAPDEIRPEYLRLPDAEIARRAAGTH